MKKEARTVPSCNILSVFFYYLRQFLSYPPPSHCLSPVWCGLLTDGVLPSFTPVDSLTNHVAWRCLLSNGTNQAHSEGPEVNWHGCGRDGRQPIRLYWFKRIAPHLRGIYQCVNCPLANHKSPALGRPRGFVGYPEDWRDSIGRILSK